MLKGVDVSNWQPDLQLQRLQGIDFAIIKATEGTWFVDPCCDGFVQESKAAGLLWGFYHFAGNGNPENEAEFFYDNCRGYIGEGIAVLDYETNNNNDISWIEKFCSKFHSLSKVWPVIYKAEYFPFGNDAFSGSWIPEKCGLWCANYNHDYLNWPTVNDCPVNPFPWDCVAIWQFASDFHIQGYYSDLDADIAFMSKDAWKKYAKGEISTNTGKPVENNPDTGKKILTGRVTIELD